MTGFSLIVAGLGLRLAVAALVSGLLWAAFALGGLSHARDVAALITQMKAESITAVFVENTPDSRLLGQIPAETGAKVGGTLFSDALSGPDGPASTYLNMMRHTTATLTAALKE
ncbi:MAG: zinc ABC transporter substrate-binding protein [Pseudotabrizicola sp.]|uniref:metal ABC transporter solute-binding protein, Zn/Mn family n=1 Tax=Pseudotabrizicola sp. TaxID=2939647 RepID=UPI002721FFD9|nr:zinc ABC transporter substrate-binding protein [Pseudotabrizicola sp.]MDO9637000.1 zinc ABC transporter substrate-binding protein [Pseudotabrizicola sp.]